MADQNTNRASQTPSSAASSTSQPAQASGEPDNESQYGGGRQVDMPREQNREAGNPPKPNKQKEPVDNDRVRNGSGPSEAS